jgi:soluble lytic murein transglycosylase-like protein
MNTNSSLRYDDLFQKFGLKFNIPWKLLKAQVRQESNFNPDAQNKRSGAKGLVQFMDKTWQEWCDLTPGIQPPSQHYDPFNPSDAVSAQAAYMKFLIGYIGKKLNDKSGIISWALAAYNWGVGNVIKLIDKTGPSYQLSEPHLPSETSSYVRNIIKYFGEYNAE